MRMKIHTKGITGSATTKKGEEPGAMFSGLLEIDGEIYDRVTDINVEFGDKFTTITATFIPGSLEIINHTEESWPGVVDEATDREQRAVIRQSEGRVIAVYVSPKPKDV